MRNAHVSWRGLAALFHWFWLGLSFSFSLSLPFFVPVFQPLFCTVTGATTQRHFTWDLPGTEQEMVAKCLRLKIAIDFTSCCCSKINEQDYTHIPKPSVAPDWTHIYQMLFEIKWNKQKKPMNIIFATWSRFIHLVRFTFLVSNWCHNFLFSSYTYSGFTARFLRTTLFVMAIKT